jgi:uncharacterized membrane protein
MNPLLVQFLTWYLVTQVIALAALPLTLRFFVNLPDRGYAFARVTGILLTGILFWLAYSYGLVRNEPGSAWLAVLVVAALSVAAGWPLWRDWQAGARPRIAWGYIAAVEALFLAAFVAWAVVRAYDPAANHTEKPMDLMFMNSIAASSTYPPQDAWLAGHPISYYYFGYWLLTMLGSLAGQPPAIAYNLGQAAWYGLLLSTVFGLVYNLLAARRDALTATLSHWGAGAGGLIAALMVGVAANVQGLLEWLHANGVNVAPLAAFFQVQGFPADAPVTGNWYVDFGWWWWRSSRVLQDLDLAGNHIEVIDEFPAFSYILGDNHPHVIAMPFAVLVVALALNIFWGRGARGEGRGAPIDNGAERPLHDQQLTIDNSELRGARGEGREDPLHNSQFTIHNSQLAVQEIPADASPPHSAFRLPHFLPLLRTMLPLGWAGWALITALSGALLFLNTWDYPPYWLLLVLTVFAVALRTEGWGRAALTAAAAGAILGVGAALVYLPYLLTAQSQAGGFLPNLFNPTRLPQFLAMFGWSLLLLLALLLLAWRERRPTWSRLGASALVVIAAPLLFIGLSVFLANATPQGQELLRRMPLPAGADSYLPLITQRWGGQFWTFALVGGLLTATLALGGARLRSDSGSTLLFVLGLAGIGLALVYAPEFVFLRDNFGTRMNTVFKFYYQAWLLFGLAGGYTAAVALSRWRGWRLAPALLSLAAVMLAVASSVYLLAGAYSKTNGLAGNPTFDATAYLAGYGASELAAVHWVQANTRPDAVVAEGKGGSYNAATSRISTMTGRPTLLGWDGHESQWRGAAYGAMAAGRPQALEQLYRDAPAADLRQLADQWGIDYLYLGPAERNAYGVTPFHQARLYQVFDRVFEDGEVVIYRTR